MCWVISLSLYMDYSLISILQKPPESLLEGKNHGNENGAQTQPLPTNEEMLLIFSVLSDASLTNDRKIGCSDIRFLATASLMHLIEFPKNVRNSVRHFYLNCRLWVERKGFIFCSCVSEKTRLLFSAKDGQLYFLRRAGCCYGRSLLLSKREELFFSLNFC
jgi:hypothetical protein